MRSDDLCSTNVGDRVLTESGSAPPPLFEERDADDFGEHPPVEGTRIGRFIFLRDLDGRSIAVAAGAVSAITATDDGALLMLPAGRMIHVSQTMETVLAWLDGQR